MRRHNSLTEIDAEVERHYRFLITALLAEKKKLVEGSALITLMLMSENKRRAILLKSALDSSPLKEPLTRRLCEERLVREVAVGKYAITAYGIQRAESMDILGFIDKHDFDIFNFERGLKDKEKIILFSLIAGRAFAVTATANMRDGDPATIKGWREVLEKSHEFLLKRGVVKLAQADLFPQKTSDDPVAALFRNTEFLSGKTNEIYKAAGEKQYYLAILNNNRIDPGKLAQVFNAIFGDKIMEYRGDISTFCRDAFRAHCTAIHRLALSFNPQNVPTDHTHTTMIDEAIEKAILL